ncbi:hypothetical protein, partial [Citrobacter freundii]|uniref:hypothetical protein n=1 Tax=Citrobacter freundii TaxID=546 RepID=UPI0023DDB5A0
KLVEVSSARSNTAFLMLLIFIGSLLFRMSTMNCYNITILHGRIPVAFLCSVKSWRGIFAGGLLIKGAWTEQTVEIYSWLACGAGFIDVSLCQNLAS